MVAEKRPKRLFTTNTGANGILTERVTKSGTVSGGQFDWGGRLRKSNGGAQRFPQR